MTATSPPRISPSCRNHAAPDRPLPDARALTRELASYREPSCVRSIVEITTTFLPFVLLWAAIWMLLDVSYGLCLVLAVPAAGLLVRLFIIQHDCGHGALFRGRGSNDWVGRAIGILTLTPYDVWRRTHAVHHATSGNLARRGTGDIDTLTIREYLALPAWRRFAYRAYRHPALQFGVGPVFFFVLQQRLPIGQMRDGWRPWLSAMVTNAAIVVLAAAVIACIGVGPFLSVQIPILILSCMIGGWMFYVQHQFEGTVWSSGEDWEFHAAALHGSSYYDLPPVLRWFTANIGVHHVHHLCSRIPFYRLPDVLREHPELAAIGRLTLRQSLRCLRIDLWDESRREPCSFANCKNALAAAAPTI